MVFVVMSPITWSPESWKTKVTTQPVAYPDPEALERVVQEMAQLPPLVSSWEIETLKQRLAGAARGDAFVLQGGDCAEQFEDCTSDSVTTKLKILLQMSLVLIQGAKQPVIRIGRIAGQYAKPRSNPNEVRGDVTLPSYRGDLVNRHPFTTEDRTPDPALLLKGYERAALTLNFVRALADSGFADLHHPEYWDISFAKSSKNWPEYERLVDSIRDSIQFVEAVTGRPLGNIHDVSVYTSHECLSLEYERAQTRKVPRREGWYGLSAHLPWIGMRTAHLDGAHVEYCRGIRNPIGVKVGPGMTKEWLNGLLDTLNPENEPGRLMLIHRMGVHQVESTLPGLIDVIQQRGANVLWVSDPMHGNTETTADGIKTRRFDNILGELEQCFEIHKRMGSRLGGIHFEMTGENVTECLGGSTGLSEGDLHLAYRSKVDPRLNYEQALEMAMLVANRLRKIRDDD